MRKACCAAITLVFLWLHAPAAGFDDQDTAVIDNFIARQARRERGEEYKEARKVAAGDLNHDGTPETAVLYTIEGQGGSNLYLQYVAVFVRKNGRLEASTHAEVGGKSTRSVEQISIAGNTIRLDTLEYGPKDAACCPSAKGKTTYVLRDNRLQEQKGTAARK